MGKKAQYTRYAVRNRETGQWAFGGKGHWVDTLNESCVFRTQGAAKCTLAWLAKRIKRISNLANQAYVARLQHQYDISEVVPVTVTFEA